MAVWQRIRAREAARGVGKPCKAQCVALSNKRCCAAMTHAGPKRIFISDAGATGTLA
jgi:hypothetical protein